MSEQKLSLYEVVTKLVGEVRPVGETRADEARLKNLKELTALVDRLVFDIDSVALLRGRPEHSISQAGKFAYHFLDALGIQE